MKISTSFQLQRASNILKRVSDVATALAFAGGRLTPLSILGIATHLATFIVGCASKEMSEVVADWPQLTTASELHSLMRSALVPTARRYVDEWMLCDVEGQGVLVRMGAEWSRGTFYVERDREALLAWLRERTWQRYGNHLTLAPVGRWGEEVALRPMGPAPVHDSERAREVWRRVRPMVLAGETRSVLLDGKPRTGKSTIVRQVLRTAEAELGRPLRVLRIIVSDFLYLSPSVIVSAVELYQPHALVIDDVDRLGGLDQLLDMFEQIRATTLLVLVTSNDSSKLPLALRLPGRIDEVLEVKGAGVDLAREVLGPLWAGLTVEQQGAVASWPVKVVDELGIRMRRLGTTAEAEIVDLTTRMAAAEKPKAAAEAPAATAATPAQPAAPAAQEAAA